LTVSTVGPQAFSAGGQLTSIGSQTKLPSLTTLSVRGNPMQDLNGVETLKNLTQLDLTATQVKDLGPLSSLIGTTVVLGEGYQLDTCPILYGRCESGTRNLTGGNFGSGSENAQISKWSVGQVVPGLGKALWN
jgi:Leucine-rich repeat (LRR) protein